MVMFNSYSTVMLIYLLKMVIAFCMLPSIEATHFVSPAAPALSSMGDPRLWLLGLSIVLCTVLLAAREGGVLLTPEL